MSMNLGGINYKIGVDTSELKKSSRRVKAFQRDTSKVMRAVTKEAQKATLSLARMASTTKNVTTSLRASATAMRNVSTTSGKATASILSMSRASKLNSTNMRSTAKSTQALAVAAKRASTATRAMGKGFSARSQTAAINNLTGAITRLNFESIKTQLSLRRIADGLRGAGRRVKAFAASSVRSLNSVKTSSISLQRVLGATIAATTLKRAAFFADEYKLLGDRIKAVSKNSKEAKKSFEAIEDISSKTGFSLNSLASGFSKMTFAGETVGGTTREMEALTKAMAEMALVSGTAPDKMNDAMLQFSQGLIAGKFQAQEFQSVVEAIPASLTHIAKGMGITTGELIEMKREGELLSKDVFQGLLSQTEAIAAEAAKMPVRMGRGWMRFKQGTQQGLAELDNMFNITERIATKLFEMGKGMKGAFSEVGVNIAAVAMAFKDLNDEHEKLSELVKTFIKLRAASVVMAVSIAVVARLLLSLATKANIFALAVAGIITYREEIVTLAKKVKGLGTSFDDAGSQWDAFVTKTKTGGKEIEDSIPGGDKWVTFVKKMRKEGDALSGLDITPKTGTSSPVDLSGGAVDGPSFKPISSADVDETKTILDGFLEDLKGYFTGAESLTADHEERKKQVRLDNASDAVAAAIEARSQEMQATVSAHNWELEEDITFGKKKAEIAKKSYISQTRIWKKFAEYKLEFGKELNAEEKKEAGDSFRTMLSMAGENNKEMAAVSKAFVLADIALKTPAAIANAFNYGNSVGGPVVGGTFAGIAGAAMTAQFAAATAVNYTGRAIGGDVFPGQTYKVNENGPEMFSSGGSDFLMTGSERGSITPSHKTDSSGGGSNSGVIVNIYTPEGTQATTSESTTAGGQTQMDIMFEMIDSTVAEGIVNGTSKVNDIMTSTFGLSRSAGALI